MKQTLLGFFMLKIVLTVLSINPINHFLECTESYWVRGVKLILVHGPHTAQIDLKWARPRPITKPLNYPLYFSVKTNILKKSPSIYKHMTNSLKCLKMYECKLHNMSVFQQSYLHKLTLWVRLWRWCYLVSNKNNKNRLIFPQTWQQFMYLFHSQFALQVLVVW